MKFLKQPLVGALALSFTCSGLLLQTATEARSQAGYTSVNIHNTTQVQAQATGQYRFETVDQEWVDKRRNRTIPVKLYIPQGVSGPCPVILFSHGLGGSREAAQYLGKAWAGHGYLCVFMQHAGSDKGLWEGVKGYNNIVKAIQPGANGKAAVDRTKDVSFVIDYLEANSRKGIFMGCPVDLTKIGMSGHSFGAITSLWVAGQRIGAGFMPGARGLSFAEPRISAVVYLSPGEYNGRLSTDQAFGDIKIPGMVVTGTQDTDPIRKSSPEGRAQNFDYINATNQYLLYYDGAAHQTFGGRSRRGKASELDLQVEKSLSAITCQFWDAYLKNNNRSLSWLKGDGLNRYLGSAAVVKKK